MTVDRLRLARTDGVGPVTYRRLLRRFGTAAAALDALPGIARQAGRSTPPAIPTAASARREIDALGKLKGRLLFLDDAEYPALLAAIEAGPAVLSVQGDPAILSSCCVAIVGARNASANGQRMAELLAADLGIAGVTVVSGLARGIDAAAHRGALRSGRTIAAIAGGLDMPYPPENAALQAEIAEAGVVVAEAPLGTAPIARHFPRRNRVISGLSLGVVVVEAAPRSGSLITARMAIEANRLLFAVPGSPLDPRCRGSNDLIRSDGAILTESAADVTPHLGALAPQRPDPDPSPGFAEPPPGFDDPLEIRLRLVELLGPAPVPVDDLVRRCQFSASAVLGILQELEAEGVVQTVGSQVCRIAD
ncbi:MAG: DNA-processing protein DprA [Janthinobacterium lividum]